MNLKRILSRCTEDGGCLIWTGAFIRGRWPRMYVRIDGKEVQISLRRVVWKLSGGRDLEPGEVVAMTCGCDACLKKKHMEVIDKAEVSRRNWAKPGAKLLRSARAAAGQSARAKLDMERARAIRERLEAGYTQMDVAAEFLVSQALVSRVKRNAAWKEYSNPFTGLLAANDRREQRAA
jgi:hypothetical protein